MGIGDGAVTNVLSGMEVWSTPEVPSRVVVAFSLLQMSDDGNKRGKLGLGTREKELVGSRKSCCTLIRFLLSGCTLNTHHYNLILKQVFIVVRIKTVGPPYLSSG